MDALEDKIKRFLTIDVSSDYVDGEGCVDGYVDVDGYGSGSGSGELEGYGCGYGSGYGSSSRNEGEGLSFCYSDGIKEINGDEIYIIDDIPTIIKSIRKNVAQGFIVQSDLQLKSCFIIKENNLFVHGDTLRDAFTYLQEKLYDDSTEEERIEAFMKQFPEYDVKYDNMDLFVYHHVLTGSCRMGREAFMSNKGLSLDGKTSVREFVKLTQDAYGGDIIKKLPEAYGIE